jgi:hypothetical protein
MRVSILRTSATVGRIVPGTGDEYGAVGGMRIGRVNLSIRRKPAPVPLHPPQTLHNLTWDRSRAAGGKNLATNRPSCGMAYMPA